VAGSVSPEMIDVVRRDIYVALAQTTDLSTLPAEEQDRLLAQACAEACEILGTWINSPEWKALAPSGAAAREPIAGAVADWHRVKPFLVPVREMLGRVSVRQGPDTADIEDPSAYVDDMIAAAQATGRRHRRLNRQDLYDDATDKTRNLQQRVCEIAREFRDERDRQQSEQHRAERRSRARGLLKTIGGVLLAVGLAMAGASPGAVRQNIPEWGHDIVQVLVVHNVAHTAAPTARIAPPRAGPRPG
jgi:hypothetical protein